MPGANRELFHAAHYNVIAKRIRETRATLENDSTLELGATAALDMLVQDLAVWFSEDNPRFEMQLWMEATSARQE